MNDQTLTTEAETSADEMRSAEMVKSAATMEDAAREFEPAAATPDEAIQLLKTGNARFFSNQSARPPMSAMQRRAQIAGQTPFAVIVGCADSRVPTENVFDQSAGDLFTVRVAGNVCGEEVYASVEYAVRHLKSHLIVVLGHEGCGAVKAAMLSADARSNEPENVRKLLEKILPAVAKLPAIRDAKARMREAAIANVRLQVCRMNENPTVKSAVETGEMRVIGGYYELGSGAVDFFETEEDLQIDN
jgi:carbonic anhydrase